MTLKSVAQGAALFIAVVSLAFFIIFAVHAQTPAHLVVKDYLVTGEGYLPFSSDANDHMADVRLLINIFSVIAAASIVLALWAACYADPKVFYWSGLVLIVLPLLLSLVPWEALFSSFHALFFPQGNWQFPPDSLLIQTYPEGFFVMFAVFWGAFCLLSGVLLLVLSRIIPAWLPQKAAQARH